MGAPTVTSDLSENVILTSLDDLHNWARLSSLWPLLYGTACCFIEFAALIGSRFDFDRFGLVPRSSPRQADLLIVAAPVFRGSYPGLLKHLFDLIDLNALVNTPVLLAATGGSERHALVLDHQLRPLFSFFQALTLPIGVYATEADFANYQITSEPLKARIRLAAERAAPLFGVHPNNLLKIA